MEYGRFIAKRLVLGYAFKASSFPSCSTPGDRGQCQSFAITVPVKW